MKISKRITSLLLAFAVAVSVLAVPNVDAKAAGTKTNTYTYDKKTKICYQTAIRSGVMTTNSGSASIYLPDSGDYIASVKTGSGNLISKVTYKYVYTGSYATSGPSDVADKPEDARFRKQYRVSVFAKKAGTYTLTVDIKDKSKKKVASLKIKVFASENAQPFKQFSYAGQKYEYWNSNMDISTTKGSGKLKFVVNSKEFALKKLEMGVADGAGISYKTIKNGASIKLATTTAYKEVDYSSGNPNDNYYYEYGDVYDYLKPATFFRVTYYDKKLKTTHEDELVIINVK